MRGKVGIRFAELQAKVEGKDRARFASLQPLVLTARKQAQLP